VLTQVESQLSVIARESAKVPSLAVGEARTLAAGEVLFREGDPRNYVYRVETGALCLFKLRADGSEDVIEFAFPGDLVGLGYLDTHATGAQASIETQLSCLPRTGVDPAAERTPRSRARLTASIEREVALLTQSLARTASRPDAARRVAALFVTLSRYNAYEGRDPALITDSLKCGIVAGYLDLSVDHLARELAGLEARGLIEPCPQGLRLKDLDGLERLADNLD
jgi:CRP/FNR family transcriptional regulator, anaerobic regulatory protein